MSGGLLQEECVNAKVKKVLEILSGKYKETKENWTWSNELQKAINK